MWMLVAYVQLMDSIWVVDRWILGGLVDEIGRYIASSIDA